MAQNTKGSTMIIEILKAHGKWVPGNLVDVTRTTGAAMVLAGVARIHEDQSRRDYTPKAAEPPEPQTIVVNNYFPAPEPEDEQPEPEEDDKPKRFFNRKK